MKNQNHFAIIPLLIIIIIILLQSCATTDKVTNSRIIQKRKYNAGFYVNTIRNKIKTNKNQVSGRKILENTFVIREKDIVLENSFENYIKNTDTNYIILIASIKEIQVPLQKNLLPLVNTSNNYHKPNKNIVKRIFDIDKREVVFKSLFVKKSDEPPKKIMPLALIGFSLSFIGLLCMLILKSLFWWAIVLGLIIEVVALFMSIVGLSRINKDPTRYKGKSEAIFGIIFSSVRILSILFIIIMILVFPSLLVANI